MQYRPLGKTGLQVSALGFGASPLGGVFGAVDPAESTRAVHLAIENGVNFFDVSPYYGLTKAESALGEALAGIPRESYILGTKVGRYGDKEFDFSAQRTEASVEASLKRLKVDHLDLIQCHDIEFGNIAQVIEETLPALRRSREQGKVRFIGITGLPLWIFREVLERASVDVVLSYCHYTLNDTSLESLIPYLQAKQVGIIGASPFAMGLLTERPLPAWHPAPEPIRAACRKAAAHCRKNGVDIAQLALQFALANENIATMLAGMATTHDLRKNLDWIQQPMDLALLREVREILEPIHNQTWASGNDRGEEAQ